MMPLGEKMENQLVVMDDKFWFWETTEEALRPHIQTFSDQQIMALMKTYAANYKGSEDLWDHMMQRVHLREAKLF